MKIRIIFIGLWMFVSLGGGAFAQIPSLEDIRILPSEVYGATSAASDGYGQHLVGVYGNQVKHFLIDNNGNEIPGYSNVVATGGEYPVVSSNGEKLRVTMKFSSKIRVYQSLNGGQSWQTPYEYTPEDPPGTPVPIFNIDAYSDGYGTHIVWATGEFGLYEVYYVRYDDRFNRFHGFKNVTDLPAQQYGMRPKVTTSANDAHVGFVHPVETRFYSRDLNLQNDQWDNAYAINYGVVPTSCNVVTLNDTVYALLAQYSTYTQYFFLTRRHVNQIEWQLLNWESTTSLGLGYEYMKRRLVAANGKLYFTLNCNYYPPSPICISPYVELWSYSPSNGFESESLWIGTAFGSEQTDGTSLLVTTSSSGVNAFWQGAPSSGIHMRRKTFAITGNITERTFLTGNNWIGSSGATILNNVVVDAFNQSVTHILDGGRLSVHGSLNVNTGAALRCGSNTELFCAASGTTRAYPSSVFRMDNGSAVTIEGNLFAEGTLSQPVSFQKADDHMWYGIIIQNSASSIITHCKISGAQFGVAYIGLEEKIYPSLSNSEIRDCTEGIRLYGNIQYKMGHPIKQNLIENCDYGVVIYHTAAEDPSRVENRPRFDFNTIKNCSKNGVWAARSRPAFYRNQITNNGGEGVILTDAGNAEFGQKQTPGYNTIANNNGEWQVRVSYSNPLIGLVDDEKICNPIAGGLNGIFHNNDKVKRIKAVGEGTVVQADKTLWGWPIDPKWFEDDGKAIILARCPIDPQGPREEQLLISAASKRAEGLYEQAIAAYDSLLEYYPYTTQAAAAVSGCADTYSEYAEATGDSSLKQAKIDYLEEQAEFHANPDVQVIANLYLAREYDNKSDWQTAQGIYTEMLQNNPNEELKGIIYRALVNLYARGLNDYDSANQVIDNMENEIPGSKHIEISRLDLALFTGDIVPVAGGSYNKTTAGFRNTMRENTPSRYSLEQNFPNPFNPTTEIWFKLGDDSFIKLKLFDILGREIKTMAEGNYSNGYHRLTLNANEISSGVYTYKLEATSITDPSTSFVQVRKMLLLR